MTIKPLRRVAVAFVASQCLIGMTALVAVSERAMGADASETSAVQSKQTKEPVRRMTSYPQRGTIEYHPDFPSRYIVPRPVEVWLPEGYDATSDVRYPVLYVHDGQFMFHHGQTPFSGTDWLWDVDTTMARLIEDGEIRPAIVVAAWANLDAKPNRGLEYMPQKPVTEFREAIQTWWPLIPPSLAHR